MSTKPPTQGHLHQTGLSHQTQRPKTRASSSADPYSTPSPTTTKALSTGKTVYGQPIPTYTYICPATIASHAGSDLEGMNDDEYVAYVQRTRALEP